MPDREFSIAGTVTSGEDTGKTFDATFVIHDTSTPPPPNLRLQNARNNAGFYSGAEASGVANYASFESQMGRKFWFVDLNVGHINWSDFSGSAWGNFVNTGGWQNRTDLTVCLTVPLRVDAMGRRTTLSGGPALIRSELAATANGANDSKYTTLAGRLVAAGHEDAVLRLGHEGDITWYPWSWLNGNHDIYVAAFRRVSAVMRDVSSAFRIDYQGNGSPWNANYTWAGQVKPYGDWAYPGDEFVDIVGVDTYNRQSWAATKANLDYTKDLAVQHGKQMSVPEWGLWRSQTGDDPTYIQNMFSWLSSAPNSQGPGSLAYHCYFWNHVEANLNSAPLSKAKYKELFAPTS